MKNDLKILFIGNSFSDDTTYYAPDVALHMGAERVKICNLYVGGCSIDLHLQHFENDMPVYAYRVNEGAGWNTTPEYKISDAVKSEHWDYIAIQAGTKDGCWYTEEKTYANLEKLVKGVKAIANQDAKIAFNMTWIGEPDFPKPEIEAHNGDQFLMHRKVADIMKNIVSQIPEIDCVIPTGTAVQNARTSTLGKLTRDGYHLNMTTGRYIAAMTFISKVTGVDVSDLDWAPYGVGDVEKRVAIESVRNAIACPYELTKSQIKEYQKIKLINYAHRGASEYAPENTLSSFYLGLMQGANGIETDVQRTKDGVLVLFHDDTIDRVTDGHGTISDYTLDELRRFRVYGNSVNGFYDRIVTFREFLEKFSCYNINFAIEMKETGLEEDILSMAKEFGIMEKSTFTSFKFECIVGIKKVDPNARVGWLVSEVDDEKIEKLLSIGGEEMAPKASVITDELWLKLRNKGLGVRAWGVSNTAIMKTMCERKVDGMTVNFPDRLNQYINTDKI